MAPDRDELRDPLECTTWIVDKLRRTRYNKVAAYLTEHTVGLPLIYLTILILIILLGG